MGTRRLSATRHHILSRHTAICGRESASPPNGFRRARGFSTTRRLQIAKADGRPARTGWPRPPVVLALRRHSHPGKGLSIFSSGADSRRPPRVSFALVGYGAIEADIRGRWPTRAIERPSPSRGRSGLNPSAWYRAADFTDSRSSRIRMSASESLAAGTPVLGTPVAASGGSRALSGALFFRESTADLIRGLGEVLRGERPLPDAATCQRYAAEHFDWPVVVARVRGIYKRVLDSAERQSL